MTGLPNEVTMEAGMCPSCEPGSGSLHVGVNCGGCKHHFHIGPSIFEQTTPIYCPRCEGACIPSDITGNKDINEVMTEEQMIELLVKEVQPEVAAAVWAIQKTKKNRDPNFWLNVCTRESWRFEHGSYDEWDEASRASGVDPAQYEPAALN